MILLDQIRQYSDMHANNVTKIKRADNNQAKCAEEKLRSMPLFHDIDASEYLQRYCHLLALSLHP